MGKIVIASFFAVTVFAQDVERTFRLKHATAATAVQEITTTLRVVGGVEKIKADTAAATIMVAGSADRIALQDWLVPKLDIAGPSGLSPQEFHLHNAKDEIVLVYELAHVTDTTWMQEIITNLRTVGDIQFVYNISASKIIALRGTPGEVEFARSLMAELDQTPQPRSAATIHRLKFAGTPADTVEVYGLVHANDVLSKQMILTTLRSVIETKQIYQTTAPNLLTFRGTAAEMGVAEWLISELDRTGLNSGGNEMRMPGGKDDVVHVFYLVNRTDSKTIMGLITELRGTAHLRNIYYTMQPAAIALRGTADQVAMAGKMIALRDQPTQ